MSLSLKVLLPIPKSKLSEPFSGQGLTRLLSKGDQFQASPVAFTESASTMFGLMLPKQQLPYASILYSADTEVKSVDTYICVDPVHLQADLSDSLLYPPSALNLSDQESSELFESLQQHFSEYRFEKTPQGRWYIKLAEMLDVLFMPLEAVGGRYINACLPKGENAKQWLAFLNEVQMLFFNHSVNQRREQNGLLAANSVWLYGNGQLPKQVGSPFTYIYSDDSYIKGLAVVSETSFAGMPEAFEQLLSGNDKIQQGQVLLAFNPSLQAENKTLIDYLTDLDNNWFVPMYNALKSGKVDQIEFDFCEGKTFAVKQSHLKRFWRFNRTLSQIIK